MVVFCLFFPLYVINMHGYLIKEQLVSNSPRACLCCGSELIIFLQQTERILDRDLSKCWSCGPDPADLLVSSESQTLTVSAGGKYLELLLAPGVSSWSRSSSFLSDAQPGKMEFSVSYARLLLAWQWHSGTTDRATEPGVLFVCFQSLKEPANEERLACDCAEPGSQPSFLSPDLVLPHCSAHLTAPLKRSSVEFSKAD